MNKHIDIAYLNKPAHCYIKAANLRSNNIYGSWKSLPILAALLYIALYRKQHTPNVNSCSREICFITQMFQLLAFFKFRSVKRNILTLKENIIKL